MLAAELRPTEFHARKQAESAPGWGSRGMGYFVLTTVCTLTYLGYFPIPKNLLIAACVVYVLYDAFKR
jgi:hypothetical protein